VEAASERVHWLSEGQAFRMGEKARSANGFRVVPFYGDMRFSANDDPAHTAALDQAFFRGYDKEEIS
jgi:hypothetical protein